MRVLFLLIALLLPSAVAAQPFVPDNRYDGYPSSLVQMTVTPLSLATCIAQEYYEPLDLHLVKYETRVKIASVRIQKYDECTWMLTRNKWRWVLRPAGTKVAQDAEGRDLFDFGSPTGNKCANPRPWSIAVVPPAEPIFAAPAPKLEVSALKPFQWRRYVLPPPPPPPIVPEVPAPVVQKKRNWKKIVGFVAVGAVAAWGINSKWGNTNPRDPGKTEGPGRPPG